MASVGSIKAMRMGYGKAAETYLKHMVSTDPVLALSWFLGTTGIMMPLLMRNDTAIEAEKANAIKRHTFRNPGSTLP